MFTPLLRQTLAAQIQEQLRSQILSGRWQPGDALPSERELVGLFGASRVAIREALIGLQAQGLLERGHGRVTRVLAPSAVAASLPLSLRLPEQPLEQSVRDIKQARLVIEADAARLAAQQLTSDRAKSLRAALRANRDAIANRADYIATDLALHDTIARLSGNQIYVSVGRELRQWLARFRIEAVHVEGSNILSHREHACVVERILARDPDGAAQAMVDHLSRSHQAYGRFSNPGDVAAEELPQQRKR